MKTPNIPLKPLVLLTGLAIGISLALYIILNTPGKLLGMLIKPGTLVILLLITIIIFWKKTNP